MLGLFILLLLLIAFLVISTIAAVPTKTAVAMIPIARIIVATILVIGIVACISPNPAVVLLRKL